MFQNFVILSESTTQYMRFNAVSTQLTVRLAPPTDNRISLPTFLREGEGSI